MTKSVSILLPSYRPIGVVRVMFRLAAGLLAEGIGVALVIVSGDDEPPFPVPEGVNVVALGARVASGSERTVADYLSSARPDAVLAASNPCALAAVLARDLSGVTSRVVITIHTELSRLWEQELTGYPAKIAKRMADLYPRSDAVTTVSGGVADDLARITGLAREDMRVIYNGIDLADARRRAAQPATHPWFDGESNDGPIVLGVGRLGPQKDFPTLLKAVAKVRTHRPLRLMILGRGPQEQTLRKLASSLGFTVEKDFALPGFIENPLPFMRSADLFALSSAYEGLPTVVMEALAVGTPVVSTDCPSGPRELLDGGAFGPLVPVGDADALAEAIDRTLANPLPGERLQERAGVFSLERMVSGYRDALFG